MTKEEQLLAECLYALNKMPNYKGACKDGSSSYDLASKVDKHIHLIVKEDLFLKNPEVIVYQGESGKAYNYKEVLKLAKNNSTYAMMLLDKGRAYGEDLEDILSRDLEHGIIFEFKGSYKFL